MRCVRFAIGFAEGPDTTYELQCEAPLLLWIPGQPNILEVTQGDLILVVHSVYRDGGVV